MFHRIKSVQFKLVAIFLVSVLLPLLILLAVLSTYFEGKSKQDALVSAKTTVMSISKNVEIYLHDLENITLIPYINDDVMKALQKKVNYMGKEVSNEELYEINSVLLNELSVYFQLMRQDISELLILPVDGSVYLLSGNSAYYRKEYDYREQDWYREAIEAEGRAVLIGNHEQDYIMNSKQGGVFSVVRQIRDIETRKVLAVILADTKTSVLASILQYMPFDDGVYCFVLDGKGKIVCANDTVPEQVLEQIQNRAGEDTIQDFLVSSSMIEGTSWQVVMLLPRSNLVHQRRVVYLAGAMISVLYLLFGSMLFFFVSRHVTNPLGRLSAAMKEVERGNFQVVCQMESDDEIARLGNNFNTMANQINELIEKEYKAVLAKKDMEYYALQSQIHPHFIYNVLNSLVGLNRAGEKEVLEKTVISLTEILRYMLNQKDMVKISVELDVIEKYCQLQKLRFGKRMEYIIACEKEFDSYMIPKLLLQPLVENSILHGIEPMNEGGLITLFGEEMEEEGEKYLLFTVTDNGEGFDKEKLEPEISVGLKNIRERLAIVYTGASFSIDSSPGNGTVVKIRIPRRELKNEDCDC